ncbi:hypothetical protein DLAC_08906 [Tieghemostelium lacteum]|uniref:Uncharacterized protein n=1 Tax=Tieghemostelium lacteum TaxID=361077 RepID=A0A151Z8Y6_TIELA|nr:hypothetical protein DLAC_08906 [Tieghemostelium lacteum]|eukprot:KYQ90304.1 hypothetical protein DLAC_08906 [Tieghemostelium lacteum]
MNFKITIVVLLAVLACCNASVQSSKDLGDFLLGVVEGLEFTVSSHAKTCIQDTTHTIDDFKSAYESIDHGMDAKSAHDILDGMKDFGKALVEVPIIYEECGVTKFVSEIKSLASKLEEGDAGVIEVIIKELVNIFHHSHDLTDYFKDAIADEKKGSYTSFGINVGKIVGILLKD